MQDLNALAYFAHVADHGGFAAAERATGIPKSKLSRRVADLEQRLGAAGRSACSTALASSMPAPYWRVFQFSPGCAVEVSRRLNASTRCHLSG